MLSVLTTDEALRLMLKSFPEKTECETVSLGGASGRVPFSDVLSDEYVPGFDRATMDGYAVSAVDTYGCSDALPAVLTVKGGVSMGERAPFMLKTGECASVLTGGALPEGSDAVAMKEHCEDFCDGTIGVSKPVAPGGNVIRRGEDGRPGDVILKAGRKLLPQDTGTLAAFGKTELTVYKRPVVGVISTGDELVPASEKPGPGRIRDVNMPMLTALLAEAGCEVTGCGILRDDEALLDEYVKKGVRECDCLIISGGTSVGMKDACERVLSANGELLFHGLLLKPGKPTIAANIDGKPVFGLPGNPVAAWFVTRLIVTPLLNAMQGFAAEPVRVRARLTEAISSNHGREECVGVFIEKDTDGLSAIPVHGKSGLISSIAGTDGYIRIPAGLEGIPKDAAVEVILY